MGITAIGEFPTDNMADTFLRQMETATNDKSRKHNMSVRPREKTGVTTGLWDSDIWDSDVRMHDRLYTIYSPQDGYYAYDGGLYDEAWVKCPHLQSSVMTRVKSVLTMPRRIIPYDNSKEAIKRAEFVTTALARAGRGQAAGGFNHFLTNAQKDGLYFPYSVSETVWSYENRMLVPDQFKVRHPRNFVWDDTGTRCFFVDTEYNRTEVNYNDFVIYAPMRERDHPYLGGIGRQIFHIYNLWRLNLKWWAVMNERGGIPIIIVKNIDEIDDDEMTKLEDSLDGLRNNVYVVLPEGIEVDAFESRMKAGTSTCRELAEFCEAEISKTILGQTLTTQEGDSGSYSLGNVHENILGDYQQYDAMSLMGMVNDQIIPSLVAYNFTPRMKDGKKDWLLPKFVIEFEPPEDLAKRLLVVQGLYNIGYPLSKKYLVDTFGVPMAVDEKDTLVKAEPTNIGQLTSQDPGTTNTPGVDNKKPAPGDKDIKQKGPDTNKGKGDRKIAAMNAYGRVTMAKVTSFLSQDNAMKSMEARRTMEDTFVSAGQPYQEGVNRTLKSWLGHFDSLESIQRNLNYGTEGLIFPEFEEFVKNAQFQAYVTSYHLGSLDPRIKAESNPEDEVTKATLEVFEPKQVIDLFENRGILTRDEFDLLESHFKSRSFTVANVTREILVDELKPLVMQGIIEGKDVKWFVNQTEGLLTPKHAETVFRTNMASAFETARADMVLHPDAQDDFPAISYFVVLDEGTTPVCRNLVGKVVPTGEARNGPFIPPFHYNCRTTIMFIHKSEYDKMKAHEVYTTEMVLREPPRFRPQSDFGYHKPILIAS